MDKKHLKLLIEKTSYLNVLKDNIKPTKKIISPELVLISELMSSIPTDLDRVKGPRKEMEILRAAIIAEYDAINLYEQMAEISSNPKVKKVLLDVANEEKQHIGEFKSLLEMIDPEHEKFEKKGEEEVKLVK